MRQSSMYRKKFSILVNLFDRDDSTDHTYSRNSFRNKEQTIGLNPLDNVEILANFHEGARYASVDVLSSRMIDQNSSGLLTQPICSVEHRISREI